MKYENTLYNKSGSLSIYFHLDFFPSGLFVSDFGMLQSGEHWAGMPWCETVLGSDHHGRQEGSLVQYNEVASVDSDFKTLTPSTLF